jgi:hypothetical protein
MSRLPSQIMVKINNVGIVALQTDHPMENLHPSLQMRLPPLLADWFLTCIGVIVLKPISSKTFKVDSLNGGFKFDQQSAIL